MAFLQQINKQTSFALNSLDREIYESVPGLTLSAHKHHFVPWLPGSSRGSESITEEF
jgi:hypothetical protein